MADYAKKTVAELQELLKARSLPHTGKKAELVSRLSEDDKSKQSVEVEPVSAEAAAVPPAETAEESIPKQQPTLAKPIDPVDAPAVPAPPAPSTDPSTTTHSTNINAPEPASNPSTFSANLSTSNLQSELEKRKARAARFGATSTVEEIEKAMQRAARFGTSTTDESNTGVKGLDEALPDRREQRTHKGSRQAGGRNRSRRGRSGTPGTTTGRVGEKGAIQKQQTVSTAYSSEKDRLAAERRKERFARV